MLKKLFLLIITLTMLTSNIFAVTDGYVWVGGDTDYNQNYNWVYYTGFAPASEVPPSDAAWIAILADLTAFGAGPVANMPTISNAAPDTTIFFVGYGQTGQSTLSVANGGSVNTASVYVGYPFPDFGGGDGILNVDGTLVSTGDVVSGQAADSGIPSVGDINVGATGNISANNVIAGSAGGTGTVDVAAGGEISANMISAENGTFTINGSINATTDIKTTTLTGIININNGGIATAGVNVYNNGGSMNVASGGTLSGVGIISQTGSIDIAGSASATQITANDGSIAVSGTASATNDVYANGGEITIDASGQVTAGINILSHNSGTMTINGTANATGDLNIDGDGTMNVGATGSATANANAVAFGGTLNVADSGSLSGNNIFAYGGNINIDGTATATSEIVAQDGSSLSVNSTGDASAGTTVIARSGGTLNVANGGSISGGNILAYGGNIDISGTATSAGDINADATGAITVYSGGNLSNSAGNIISFGGPITINNGGTVNSAAGILAGNGAGAGLVNINGTATTGTWDTIAGHGGSNGVLNVGSTGSLTTNSLIAGIHDGSIGDISIAGTVAAGNIFAGFAGNNSVGTISINTGANVTCSGNVNVANGNSTDGFSDGVLNINGGSLTAIGLVGSIYEQTGLPSDTNWYLIGGAAQVNINDGTLEIDAFSGFQGDAVAATNDGLEINISSGANGKLVMNGGDDLAAAQWYEGMGSLIADDGWGAINYVEDNSSTPNTLTITAVAGEFDPNKTQTIYWNGSDDTQMGNRYNWDSIWVNGKLIPRTPRWCDLVNIPNNLTTYPVIDSTVELSKLGMSGGVSDPNNLAQLTIVDGGSLVCDGTGSSIPSGAVVIGWGHDCNSLITVDGGEIICGSMGIGSGNTDWGYSVGTLTINDGSVTTGYLDCGVFEFQDPDWIHLGGFANVNLNGGELHLGAIAGGWNVAGLMDISGGTLYLAGDMSVWVLDRASDNSFVAYSGAVGRDITAIYDSANNVTIVAARYPGDFNDDGVVDLNDFAVIAENWTGNDVDLAYLDELSAAWLVQY